MPYKSTRPLVVWQWIPLVLDSHERLACGFCVPGTTGASIFIGAGIFMLLLALVIVNYQSLRAALINPLKSLRTE